MRSSIALVAAVLCLTLLPVRLAHARQAASPAKPAVADRPSPAGKWTSSVDTPHGAVTMDFDLTLTADKLTGTMTTDMTGTVPVAGTFVDGTVVLSATAMGGIDFRLTFKDQDTMTGNLSSQMGDLACTATRRKDAIGA
jgi:hypothetical protein